MKWLPLAAYIACIVGANWAIVQFGLVPVGFGLVAPAGVYLAGFTFAFRNVVQQALGRRWGFACIGIGALLSYAITDKVTIPGGLLPLAIASGITFLLSETADALVWNQLRERHWWIRAMCVGEACGMVVDSIIFLTLALGSLELLAGQILGKLWTIVPVILLMLAYRAVLARDTRARLA
jgi:uncharacterized PurR-regulated membrane protein YhhQ (DUF165 family)